MKLAVLKAGKKLPSKFNYGMTQRVTLEDIDNPGKYYYLNLVEAQGVVDRWLPAIVEGNVIEVSIIEGTNQVNKFGQYQVIRRIKHDSEQDNRFK